MVVKMERRRYILGIEKIELNGVIREREESKMMIIADNSIRVFMPHNSESRYYY